MIHESLQDAALSSPFVDAVLEHRREPLQVQTNVPVNAKCVPYNYNLQAKHMKFYCFRSIISAVPTTSKLQMDLPPNHVTIHKSLQPQDPPLP